jgi:pyrroloquinoline-quinone synthase
MSTAERPAWSAEEFERRLRAMDVRYHIHHPYHLRMAEGSLNREQIQGWVRNRFYYQVSIPRKDAAVMANCPDRELRRAWIQRVLDHDGQGDDPGGIEAWTRLGEACGIPRAELTDLRGVLPGVRFAVDAYVNFARSAPWEEAVASSLTELFAPTIHKQRLAGWPAHYPWIAPEGLSYFQKRVSQAGRDVEHGLAVTLARFDTRAKQDRVVEILQFKLDVLWTMLDAMWTAYVDEKPPYFNCRPVEAVPTR